MPKKDGQILASSSGVHYLWFVLKYIHTIQARSAAALFVLALLLGSCGKEALIEPSTGAPAYGAKNIGTPGHGDAPDPSNGSTRDDDPTDDEPVTGSGDGISDDGDDLSDTERNRKKK